jgi:hypothetical protein
MNEPSLQIEFVGPAGEWAAPTVLFVEMAGLVGPEHTHCRGTFIVSRPF